jgi:beta-galactosidase
MRLPSGDTQRKVRARKVRALPESLPIKKQIADSSRQARATLSLNQGWLFRRCETGETESGPSNNGQVWETVNLPHSVRLEPLNASGCRNYQGVCWYHRKLQVSPDWAQRKLYLHFEGAMQVAELWVNNRKVATHHCGYTPWTVDITPFVTMGPAENILAVRLDNSDDPTVPPGKPQRELDFTYFGGLYRNVNLIVSDRLHISDPMLADQAAGGGVFVTFPSVTPDTATLRVQTHVLNEHDQPRECTVRQELMDADGTVVATASARSTVADGNDATMTQFMDVAHPKLWHPDHPHLYWLRTIVEDSEGAVDQQITRIGIRHIRFDPQCGLFINGQKFLSIGTNRHQDHPYVGYALPDSAQWRDVKKLREAGFTSFRNHYPQSPSFMDACDELGMLAIVSNPGWQYVGDDVFQQRAIQNARVMVRRDRNRPSVILWEGALNESENKDLGQALQQAIHEEYPGNQCYTAGDHEPGFSWHGSTGWDVEYLHNDGSKPYWIREWGDHVDNWSDQQSRSRVPRAWGESPMLIQANSHIQRLNEIVRTDGGTRIAGACLWAGIDCQRGYHHQPFHGGVLDLFRLPKFNYFFFQSQRPPRVHVPALDDGPMVFIANFATFFSPTAVTIYSNCDEVRFLVNGEEIDRRKPDRGHAVAHPPFTFSVQRFADEQSTMFMTGVAKIERPPMELKAEGIMDGKVVASHIVHPAGVATKLMMEADLCGRPLVADGSDWVRVHAKVCDARGTVCSLADDLVKFSIKGEGQLIGGSDIGANPVRAEAGIATALVQANERAGRIIVKATAFGLTAAEVEITSLQPSFRIGPRS